MRRALDTDAGYGGASGVVANEARSDEAGVSNQVFAPTARSVSSGCAEEHKSEVTVLFRHAVLLGAILLACWLGCFWVWRTFPEMVPGSLRVYDQKLSTIQTPGLFPINVQRKILVVGHSYTMAGFEPLLFETLASNACSTFNLGLPVTVSGRRIYTLDEILDALQKSGNAPTHVLVTWREPWPPGGSQANHSARNWITPKFDSALAMQKLFPFRQLARDGPVFFIRAFSRGGIAVFRQTCNNEVSKMLHDRGYYFLKSNSIYPTDELPADFSAPGDSPNIRLGRDVKVWEEFVASLKRRANGPRILLVPNYYRENRCTTAPSNDQLREVLQRYGVEVVGPDYWQYPNQMFSDAAHLNPTGAEVYTRDLWLLLKDHLAN